MHFSHNGVHKIGPADMPEIVTLMITHTANLQRSYSAASIDPYRITVKGFHSTIYDRNTRYGHKMFNSSTQQQWWMTQCNYNRYIYIYNMIYSIGPALQAPLKRPPFPAPKQHTLYVVHMPGSKVAIKGSRKQTTSNLTSYCCSPKKTGSLWPHPHPHSLV